MIGSENFPDMSIERLAEHCADETRKFRQKIINDTRYCFELLCRAFRDANEVALSHSYHIYLPLLAARARRHECFPQSCQNADAFARAALANAYNAIKGEKFLKKFSKLEAVIAYLYTCVHTAILQDIKGSSNIIPLEDDSLIATSAPSPDSTLAVQELWSHVIKLLPDATDQHLARLCFVLAMKPAEIVQHYPHIWTEPRDVSVVLQRIRRHLRSDPYLSQLAGLDTETNDENRDENP